MGVLSLISLLGVVAPERRRAPAAPPPAPPGPSGPQYQPPEPPRKETPWGLIAVLLVIIALFSGINWVRGVLPDLNFDNPFRSETIDRSGPPLLQSIQDLREYHAAAGNFQVIVDREQDTGLPDELLGERTLFVAAGTVDATVDFSRVGSGAIDVSDERRAVTITLPQPRLGDARVDPARSYVYERDQGAFNKIGSLFSGSDNDERELYLLAEQKLTAAAQSGSGLVQRARENTRAMLTSMVRALGFTSVTVRFVATPAS
jgi:hypothetical protein